MVGTGSVHRVRWRTVVVVVSHLQIVQPPILLLKRQIMVHKRAKFNRNAFIKFLSKTGQRTEAQYLIILSLYDPRATGRINSLPRNFPSGE